MVVILVFKVMVRCPECRFAKILMDPSEIMETCPSCGSNKLEYIAFWSVEKKKRDKKKFKIKETEKTNKTFIGPAMRLQEEGTWEIDLDKVMKEDVSIAEEEDGEYSLFFRINPEKLKGEK